MIPTPPSGLRIEAPYVVPRPMWMGWRPRRAAVVNERFTGRMVRPDLQKKKVTVQI